MTISAIGIAILSLWALGMTLYVLRVPKAYRLLRRLNSFRFFAHWTMFSVGPNQTARPTIYELERRRTRPDESNGEWTVVASDCRWVPWSFIGDPRRHISSRLHQLGRAIEHSALKSNDSTAREEMARNAILIKTCFGDDKRGSSDALEFRLVKRSYLPEGCPSCVLWQFSTRSHDR